MSNQPGIFANAVNLKVGGAAQASAASEDARTTSEDDAVHDVVIVGSGPAGYTAAIYTARANLNPVVLAGSVTAGGELMNTTDVENYPGFIDGIMGPDLMNNMQQQAERFGADIRYEDVVSAELDGEIKTVTVEDGTVLRARAVIISPVPSTASSVSRTRNGSPATVCRGVPRATGSSSRSRTSRWWAAVTPRSRRPRS